ncbi:unnamed protein product [Linum trigynum]
MLVTVIDEGNKHNLRSAYAMFKLGLSTWRHPSPYPQEELPYKFPLVRLQIRFVVMFCLCKASIWCLGNLEKTNARLQ